MSDKWNTNEPATEYTRHKPIQFMYSIWLIIRTTTCKFFPPCGATDPIGPGLPYYQGCTLTLRHTTLSRTPLDEGAARRRDLYLATHNTHKRQPYVPPAGFEPTIPAVEWQQTQAFDSAAPGIRITLELAFNLGPLFLLLLWLCSYS